MNYIYIKFYLFLFSLTSRTMPIYELYLNKILSFPFSVRLRGKCSMIFHLFSNWCCTLSVDLYSSSKETSHGNHICKKNTVFWLFVSNIETEEKCHVYHFVEQVKLYQPVYDSIWTVKKFQEKNSQKLKLDFFAFFDGIFLECIKLTGSSQV